MSHSTDFSFNAEARTHTGKAVARRLRRADQVPGIIYGANKAPVAITLEHKALAKALNQEAVYSQILNVTVGENTESVILKAIERHHTKPKIMHVDFMRVDASQPITVRVPLHFIGEENCPGVKAGGVVSHLMTEVEIKCLPGALPEYIEVDMSQLENDHTLHLSDARCPANVALTTTIDDTHNPAVVSIHAAKTNSGDDSVADDSDTPTTAADDATDESAS